MPFLPKRSSNCLEVFLVQGILPSKECPSRLKIKVMAGFLSRRMDEGLPERDFAIQDHESQMSSQTNDQTVVGIWLTWVLVCSDDLCYRRYQDIDNSNT